MAKQLGKFRGDTPRLITDDVGKMTFSIDVDPEYRFIMQNLIQEARRLDKDEKSKLVVTVQEYRNARSIEQNAMMWALLDAMALHMNGGRPGSVTAEDCYCNMIEKYGAKYQYYLSLPDAVDDLRPLFRAIKVCGTLDVNGTEMVALKCYYGSSKYDTQEMSQLIEGILDELAKHGIDCSEVAYQREAYESWQSVRNTAKG